MIKLSDQEVYMQELATIKAILKQKPSSKNPIRIYSYNSNKTFIIKDFILNGEHILMFNEEGEFFSKHTTLLERHYYLINENNHLN